MEIKDSKQDKCQKAQGKKNYESIESIHHQTQWVTKKEIKILEAWRESIIRYKEHHKMCTSKLMAQWHILNQAFVMQSHHEFWVTMLKNTIDKAYQFEVIMKKDCTFGH